MNEQFCQKNPAIRTMNDYIQLIALLRHFADRAQRLALDTDNLRVAAGHYATKAMYERNIMRITKALAQYHISIADVVITEER